MNKMPDMEEMIRQATSVVAAEAQKFGGDRNCDGQMQISKIVKNGDECLNPEAEENRSWVE